jgi:hypothetical protein
MLLSLTRNIRLDWKRPTREKHFSWYCPFVSYIGKRLIILVQNYTSTINELGQELKLKLKTSGLSLPKLFHKVAIRYVLFPLPAVVFLWILWGQFY